MRVPVQGLAGPVPPPDVYYTTSADAAEIPCCVCSSYLQQLDVTVLHGGDARNKASACMQGGAGQPLIPGGPVGTMFGSTPEGYPGGQGPQPSAPPLPTV